MGAGGLCLRPCLLDSRTVRSCGVPSMKAGWRSGTPAAGRAWPGTAALPAASDSFDPSSEACSRLRRYGICATLCGHRAVPAAAHAQRLHRQAGQPGKLTNAHQVHGRLPRAGPRPGPSPSSPPSQPASAHAGRWLRCSSQKLPDADARDGGVLAPEWRGERAGRSRSSSYSKGRRLAPAPRPDFYAERHGREHGQAGQRHREGGCVGCELHGGG